MKKLIQTLIPRPTVREQVKFELEVAALDLLDAKSDAEDAKVKVALAEMALTEAKANALCKEIVATQRAARVARLMAEMKGGE